MKKLLFIVLLLFPFMGKSQTTCLGKSRTKTISIIVNYYGWTYSTKNSNGKKSIMAYSLKNPTTIYGFFFNKKNICYETVTQLPFQEGLFYSNLLKQQCSIVENSFFCEKGIKITPVVHEGGNYISFYYRKY